MYDTVRMYPCTAWSVIMQYWTVEKCLYIPGDLWDCLWDYGTGRTVGSWPVVWNTLIFHVQSQ